MHFLDKMSEIGLEDGATAQITNGSFVKYMIWAT